MFRPGQHLVGKLQQGSESFESLAHSEADATTVQFERELLQHMSALSAARICVRAYDSALRGFN